MRDRGPWCQTYSGLAFYPMDPSAAEVRSIDIAHSLSMQCRFGGHCRTFYSVAEHCVRVSRIVPGEHARVGLLHDAAEAYLVDLPRPVKLAMPHYARFEQTLAKVIGWKFGVTLDPLPTEVSRADEIMLATEKRDIMAPNPIPWTWLPEPLVAPIVPLTQGQAKRAFLDRMWELGMLRRDEYETDPSAPTLPPSRAEALTLPEIQRLEHDPRFCRCVTCGAGYPNESECRTCRGHRGVTP